MWQWYAAVHRGIPISSHLNKHAKHRDKNDKTSTANTDATDTILNLSRLVLALGRGGCTAAQACS